MDKPRLTSLVQGGGCARKLPQEDLVEVLKLFPAASHGWIDERTGLMDDAAVVRMEGAARSLVLTIDIITPLVDDARTFGRIAATNAISDVYAMGGRPEVALSFLGLPVDVLGNEIGAEMLAGLHDACRDARCAIIGGHTMKDTEPKCGLAVIGSVDPDAVWSQRFAQPGDAIILTKALGTGLISQAVRKGIADETAVAEATAQMCTLNDRAADIGRGAEVHACTDVTGFGLLGHLRNVVEASRVSARIRFGEVPLLPTALALAAQDCIPGGSRRNLSYAAPLTRFDERLSDAQQIVLADAQTSGGLLLFLPAARASGCVGQLIAAGLRHAAVIGEVLGRGEPGIEVAP